MGTVSPKICLGRGSDGGRLEDSKTGNARRERMFSAVKWRWRKSERNSQCCMHPLGVRIRLERPFSSLSEGRERRAQATHIHENNFYLLRDPWDHQHECLRNAARTNCQGATRS